MVSSDHSGVAFFFPFVFLAVCVHASMHHDSCFHYVYVCVFRTKTVWAWFLSALRPSGDFCGEFVEVFVDVSDLNAVVGCFRA